VEDCVPRQVDREERRRALAEAVFVIIGERGLDGVSLRDVARQADVSMGAVQHWFSSKDEMLRFALDHMRARVLGRLQDRIGRLITPSRRDLVEAALEVMLPLDEAGRQEACVNVAFVELATVDASYADLLRRGYQRLVDGSKAQLRAASDAGELLPDVDPDSEAVALYFLAQGLVAPLLVGMLTDAEARAVLRSRLNQIFVQGDRPVVADAG
jgi:AcrR family transcriptional regulator